MAGTRLTLESPAAQIETTIRLPHLGLTIGQLPYSPCTIREDRVMSMEVTTKIHHRVSQ